MEIEETELKDFDDAAIIHFMESSGVAEYAARAISGHDVDVDDDSYDDWKKPEHENLRRSLAQAYLYGIYMKDLGCKKWHEHCRDKY